MAVFPRAVLILALIALTACDSAEERAEKHLQDGIALLEDGDISRALVEFRNVLALDASNVEALRIYAKTARQAGNVPEAFTSYVQLTEQLPNDLEARLALTEMSILAHNWDEARRHGARLAEIEGEIEGRDIAMLALRFRDAAADDDAAALRELTRRAEALAQENPNAPILEQVLIEGYLNQGDVEAAIDVAQAAIDRGEENPAYFRIVGELLAQQRDIERLEAHLRKMIEVFPEDTDAKRNLISLLVQAGRTGAAEDFLRSEIEAADDKVTTHVNLIALLRETRGHQAALDEIETALELYDDPPLMNALKAGILFDTAREGEAIELLRSVIDTAEPGDETDRYKVMLARMLVATGDEVGARALVGEVLDRDPGQVEALKIQAAWQIESDEADKAIATLRQALDQEPEDAEAMTLMARAHERNGDQQLAQDLLSLAVEASGNAPAETLRLAGVLIAQERYRNAEELLVTALRRAPGQTDLLVALGQVYLATEEWPRAEQVAATLRLGRNDRANLAADELQLRIISRREGRDQGIGFLEQLVAEGGDAAAKVALIRARLAENEGEAALALAQELLEDLPGDPRARMVVGNTELALGDFGAAEETFRGILADNAGNGAAAIQLVRVLGAQGRIDDARELVDRGLENSPDNPDLLWAKASFLERDNDFGGAIEVYERLYALNSDSPVVANNLASLLATYREDDASLERAYAVGRRLRGTNLPPFQDTYGWILYRRGEFEEALTYLEPAAAALPNDPIVRYHLGKIYAALGRNADAAAEFEAAIDRADDNDPRPQISDARSEIQRLSEESSK